MKSIPKIFWWLSALFAVFYALISIFPHFKFQTNAYDLGIFNLTIYQYAHFQIGPNTVRHVWSLLGDHFEPILFLFAPLYWIFKSYTLLIIQIIFTLIGGLGVYLLLQKETRNQKLALMGTTIFYSFFGLITALGYDYHNNTVGTMFIPWLFYFLATGRLRYYYITLFLFLLCKENMALIGIFLGIALTLFETRDKRKHGLITIIISLVYFIVALKLIELFNNGNYDHWYYAPLGNSPSEAIRFIIFHPWQALTLLFDDPKKIETWLLLLISGGIFAIFKPKYALLMIPLLAQKFFGEKPQFWGYEYHYTVEFAPLIAIGSILAIKNLSFNKVIASALIVLNLGILSWANFYNNQPIRSVFTPKYYDVSNRTSVVKAIDLIEEGSVVAAQNSLVPHLEHTQIYHFPTKNEVEYLIFNAQSEKTWPVSRDEIAATIEKLKNDPKYETVFEENGVYLFRNLGLN